jgi:methanogenic corrinoid protein MtbC1
MTDAGRLSSCDDAPIYTIKTVVQQTGLTAATLRAWERRYGVLSPGRSEGGYRLYSERDVATLSWLQSQIEAGLSISRAVARLDLLRQAGEAPELAPSQQPSRRPPAGVRDQGTISSELLEALLAFREEDAEAVLGEAFALYPVEDVAEAIMTPVLVEVGERWLRDEATIVQEHFAAGFLRRRLTALFQAYARADAGQKVATGLLAITGSAPGEWHDVGIMIVSLALRRRGWRVLYLGQNVPAGHLVQEASRLRPNLVCLSATMPDSAASLLLLPEPIAALPEPRPRLVFGGRAFAQNPELRERAAGAYLGDTARDVMAMLAQRASHSPAD